MDTVRGTSIGAFMGALYSEKQNYGRTRIRAKQWAEVRGPAGPGTAGGHRERTWLCRALASERGLLGEGGHTEARVSVLWDGLRFVPGLKL